MRAEHWLAARTPPAPAALARRVGELASAAGSTGAQMAADDLVRAAERALSRVLLAGGMTRSSALDLLAVDALVTYAVEKAADDPDALEPWASEVMARLSRVATAHDA